MQWRVSRLCVLAMALGLPALALAPDPRPTPAAAEAGADPSAQPPLSDDVVVTASRIETRQIEKMALAVTAPGDLYRTPAAQFQDPLCPGVVGLPDDFARVAVARIRSVAQRIPIRLDKSARCKVNLLLLFMPNGQSALRTLWRTGLWPAGTLDPKALADLADDPVLKDLAADPGPVHVWVNTEMRSRYGEPLGGASNPSEPAMLKTSGFHSHITMVARKDIVGSLVVIDIAALDGKALSQIADYAAMRGLARTRPPGLPGKIGTILSLFDAGAVPPLQLTRFDLAYLRALYGSMPNVAAMTKISRVSAELKRTETVDAAKSPE